MRGRVVTMSNTHGYGFVADDEGREFFVHASALQGEPLEALRVGDHVDFEPTLTTRGPAALGVRHAPVEGVIVALRRGGGTGNGFGFVRPDTGPPDRFFHLSSVAPVGLAAGAQFLALRVGDRVRYREQGGWPGERDRAVDVRPVLPEGGHQAAEIPHIQQRDTERITTMAHGTIDRKHERGYGFIAPEVGGQSIFFHASVLQSVTYNEIQEGDTVSYVEETSPDGRLRAVNVARVKQAPGHTDEARLPDAPVPGRWPTGAGRAADDEAGYDWGEAG